MLVALTSCFEKVKLLKGLQKAFTAIPVSDSQLTEVFIVSSLAELDRQGRPAAVWIWKLPLKHLGPYMF